MTIDFGAHLHPNSAFPSVERLHEIDELLGGRLRDPQRFFETYQGSGIDDVVLSQPYYMGRSDVSDVGSANDSLLEIMDAHNAYGLAAIPVTAGGEAAAREFERTLDRGYNGGAVETRTNDIELIDKELEPVFEVADSTGAPVFVHPKLMESLHPDALDDDYRLNSIFGRESALAASISKVIHEDVFARYPDLKLVFHHFGGNIASMMGRIHLQLDAGRWPSQEHVKSYTEFKTQLEDNVYLDTSGFFGYPAPLRTALEEFPASQILLGTDFPFEPRTTDELAKFVETVESVASEAQAEKILEGNAKRVLVNL